MPRRLATLALLAAVALVAGCGPKYARETFYESRDITITLRDDEKVLAGYEHPAQISAIRLSHILASLDVRFAEQKTKNSRSAVVPAQAIYPLGDLVSRALAKANPEQAVVVSAMVRGKKLKVFTAKTLTQFIVYMKNDQLVFHVARVNFAVSKNPNDKISAPKPGQEYQNFKVLRGKNIVPIGPQAVAVEWRHPDFRKAGAIRIGRGGRVERRTVLLEETTEEAPEDAPQDEDVVDLSTLTPDALRQLADLEEERRKGLINEAEYVVRRRRILAEGRR